MRENMVSMKVCIQRKILGSLCSIDSSDFFLLCFFETEKQLLDQIFYNVSNWNKRFLSFLMSNSNLIAPQTFLTPFRLWIKKSTACKHFVREVAAFNVQIRVPRLLFNGTLSLIVLLCPLSFSGRTKIMPKTAETCTI